VKLTRDLDRVGYAFRVAVATLADSTLEGEGMNLAASLARRLKKAIVGHRRREDDRIPPREWVDLVHRSLAAGTLRGDDEWQSVWSRTISKTLTAEERSLLFFCLARAFAAQIDEP
jgi:hypothetical protein